MSTTVIIVIAAVVVIVAVLLLTRDTGPRITTIERRSDEQEKQD